MSVHRGPYQAIAKKLQAFQNHVNSIVIEEAGKLEDEIIILNQDDQLAEGIDNKGQSITPEYRPFTVEVKKAKGQPYDRVTLYDEGNFYKGFHTEIVNNKIYVDSTDQKTNKLGEKYGEDIFGLTEKNIDYFNETYLKEALINRLKSQLLN